VRAFVWLPACQAPYRWPRPASGHVDEWRLGSIGHLLDRDRLPAPANKRTFLHGWWRHCRSTVGHAPGSVAIGSAVAARRLIIRNSLLASVFSRRDVHPARHGNGCASVRSPLTMIGSRSGSLSPSRRGSRRGASYGRSGGRRSLCHSRRHCRRYSIDARSSSVRSSMQRRRTKSTALASHMHTRVSDQTPRPRQGERVRARVVSALLYSRPISRRRRFLQAISCGDRKPR
jgi:hypothetical protein